MTAELPAIELPTDGSAAPDFYELRREGVGYIERMGHDHWTDYNTHDPGITVLEALSYAITELTYRAAFPIADILRSGATSTSSANPYPDQPFFTARSILTVNPTTPDDFRRLLIDLDTVRNAWLRCRTCACDVILYAWCENDRLTLSYDPSMRTDPQTPVTRVEPRGLYDVALQLEDDDTLGDLEGLPQGFALKVHFRPEPAAALEVELGIDVDVAALVRAIEAEVVPDIDVWQPLPHPRNTGGPDDAHDGGLNEAVPAP